MSNENCVVCHPEIRVEGAHWLILCPECMNRCLRECKNLARMDQWALEQRRVACNELPSESEANEILREHGLDPDEVGEHFRRVAEEALKGNAEDTTS